jgi:hypothetical protein
LIAAVLGAGMAIVTACGFPNPQILPDDQLDGSKADGEADGETGTVEMEASAIPDAIVRDDATARIDASLCDRACDCDRDNFRSNQCPDAGYDGSYDCDDLDPLIRPNQDWVAAPWPTESTHPVANDWNCNGTVQRQYQTVTNCANVTGTCSDRKGFVNNPGCGQQGDFFTCKLVGVILPSCETDLTSTLAQGCK